MRLTRDETRALSFIALLLALSAVARIAGRGEPVHIDGPALDVDTLVDRAQAERDDQQRRSRPLEEGETIDPNAAPAAELDRLPGIGPATADRIIEERDRAGEFRSLSGLADRVRGIGPVAVSRIAPHVALSDDSPSDGGRRGRPRDVASRSSIDVNHADAAELERLPGVGPVLARRIIAHRDSAGPFQAVDGLAAVPGIGPATLERLRPRIRLRP